MAVPSERNLSLVVMRDGAEVETVPLREAVTTFGRDASNHVALPHASVSRRHAEIAFSTKGILLRDLDSRNGLRVNNVPRQQAALLPGDTFEIGVFKFRLNAGAAPKPKALLRREPSVGVEIEQTVARHFPLPEMTQERQLSTIYHACFWLTELDDVQQLAERITKLLGDSLDAVEAQFYSEDLRLLCRHGAESKAVLKLAEFLAKRFQALPEAMIIEGAQIARHQRGVGSMRYLVGPLRRSGGEETPAPFLVLMRPEEWEPFTTEQRVMLQAVCQLWARATAKLEASTALRRENRALKAAVGGTLLGSSEALETLRQRLARAASTKATILLEGETGSGKEVVAQFIHEQSPRADQPFVKVNCAAIPNGLIESELFGHHKGAFTDAKESRKGKFQQANGGTLFLDEIGEMPLQVQSKVLRALENGEIEPLGGEAVQKVDVRVIAATHCNLAEMVERKEFRQDLYFRLNVFNLRVPPLREHAEDIPELARHFLDGFCRENGLAELTVAGGALKLLQKYPWPGNVRELRNVIHRCAITAINPVISSDEVKEVLGK